MESIPMHDRRRRVASSFAVAAAAVACVAVVPGANAAPARPAGGAQRLAAGNPWGKAQEVPGTTALNKGHDAQIISVSCASAGNCSAGGYYASAPGVLQAFVVSEVHGTWRKAEEVPGLAVLNKSGDAEIASVSCASAGNCSAGGWYDGAGDAFVVSEVRGRWRKAEQVPGTAAFSNYGAEIASVSCASVGNCSAGGSYSGATAAQEAIVVNEVRGHWRKAEEVPGTAALNQEGGGWTTSVSCASAGNCSAGGGYAVGYEEDGAYEAFVVSEVHGTWRKAEEAPGSAALNTGEYGEITSVSCGSAGSCSAGGNYQDASGAPNAFVVSEVHGTWRKAEEVPGISYAGITSVSCASAGNCSAGGTYGASSAYEAFVVSETHGTWRNAAVVPGTVVLATGKFAGITAVSCASAGNCSAGGSYSDRENGSVVGQAFVVSEVNGRWNRAEEVPGTSALNKRDNAEITSLSCTPGGHCSAGGYYGVRSGTEAFVVSRR
jgi:hypothetical protein